MKKLPRIVSSAENGVGVFSARSGAASYAGLCPVVRGRWTSLSLYQMFRYVAACIWHRLEIVSVAAFTADT